MIYEYKILSKEKLYDVQKRMTKYFGLSLILIERMIYWFSKNSFIDAISVLKCRKFDNITTLIIKLVIWIFEKQINGKVLIISK